MRVALDTNVLLSALMMPANSPPAELFAFWRTRKIDIVTSAEQIDEISRVTRYPRIRDRIPPALAGRLINRLRDLALVVVDELPKIEISADPDDNFLLALSEAGNAQFLVTGDKKLLSLKKYKSIRLVTPARMIEVVKRARKTGRR
jgi:uncharacterized protein